MIYDDFEKFESDYIKGLIHPCDLKQFLTSKINEILKPVRYHFEHNAYAKNLLKTIKNYKVTK